MTDTIVAQATPPGKGGVGIVRVSGPLCEKVGQLILKKLPQTRYAVYQPFYSTNNEVLDQGIALYFKSPHSFTGEDVLELQGHGGPVILDMLIENILTVEGVRLARPGEFSEQAFLNDKLDLVQAEAIADLIDASSRSAAKSAMQSLQGEFSKQVNILSNAIVHLRMYVEAAIDFPEEEIDFLNDGKITQDLSDIESLLGGILNTAKQGTLLKEGLNIVIAGRPNAGKSSLLNALSGKDSAIVTDIAGTTRDVLKEHIAINGVPLHIIDTAGLRNSEDEVEKIGINRAWEAINQADRVLFVVDASTSSQIDPHKIWPEFMDRLPHAMPVSVVRNKIDLTTEQTGNVCPIRNEQNESNNSYPVINISAQRHDGLDALRNHIAESMGIAQSTEGQFIARRRHVNALLEAQQHIEIGAKQLHDSFAGELLAEELRLAHQALCEITGEFSSDDLLGKIFSSFCIGK